MPQVREGRLALEVWGHHLRFDGALVAVGRRPLDILVFIVVAAIEVARSFVLVWATMLHHVFPSVHAKKG